MKTSTLELLQEFMGDLDKAAGETGTGSEGNSTMDSPRETGTTSAPSTGERHSENSAKVKSDVPGTTADEAAERTDDSGAGLDTPLLETGVKSNLGPDDEPTNKPKDETVDPGTSHPAKAGGEKYAAASASELVEFANSILADIAVLGKSASAEETDSDEETVEIEETKEAAEQNSCTSCTEDAKPEAEVVDETPDVMSESEKAAAFDQLAGFIAGKDVADEIIESTLGHQVATAVKQASAEEQTKEASEEVTDNADFQKWAAEESYRLYKRAGQQADGLVNFLVALEKQSMGGEADILAAMGGAGDVAPAETALPEEGLDGGGDVDPEALVQLLSILEAQGVNLEDLLGEGEVAGAEAAGESAEDAAIAANAEETVTDSEEADTVVEKEAEDKLQQLATAIADKLSANHQSCD